MRKLGLIGGMSWVSTRTYYEQINRTVQRRIGMRSSAPMLIDSLDFTRLYQTHSEEDWEHAAKVLIDSARKLEQAGAGLVVIGANSMHKVFREVEAAVDIPLLHIAECVGEKMAENKVTRAALIGTSNVMTESFYRRRLVAHGVDLLPPDMDNAELLDRYIYEELMVGKATRNAQRAMKSLITEKEQEGAQAIVLACTELEMVVDVDANILPIYDSTRIHAAAAAEWVLGED